MILATNHQWKHEKLLSFLFVWDAKKDLMLTNPGGGQGSCLSCFPRTAPVSGSTARQTIVAMLMILIGRQCWHLGGASLSWPSCRPAPSPSRSSSASSRWPGLVDQTVGRASLCQRVLDSTDHRHNYLHIISSCHPINAFVWLRSDGQHTVLAELPISHWPVIYKY